MSFKVVGVLILFLAFPLLGQGQPVNLDKQYLQFASHIVNEQILPGYQAFHDESKKFNRDITSFCKQPRQMNLAKIHQSYHKVLDRWMAIEHIRFGPVREALRLFSIHFWPDKRNVLSRQLRNFFAEQDSNQVTPAAIPTLSVSLQGLTALERLLFDENYQKRLLDSKDPFACRYAGGVAGNLERLSGLLLQEWPSFRDRMLTPGKNAEHTPKEAAAYIFQSFYDQLQKLVDQKIVTPLQEKNHNRGLRRLENWRSQRAMRNLKINLKVLEDSYRHTQGLSLLVNAGGHKQLDLDIQQRWTRANRILDSLQMGFEAAILQEKGRNEMQELARVLEEMRKVVVSSVSQAIAIPRGFNSADGD